MNSRLQLFIFLVVFIACAIFLESANANGSFKEKVKKGYKKVKDYAKSTYDKYKEIDENDAHRGRFYQNNPEKPWEYAQGRSAQL